MKEVSHCYENVSLVRVRGCILAAYFFFFSLLQTRVAPEVFRSGSVRSRGYIPTRVRSPPSVCVQPFERMHACNEGTLLSRLPRRNRHDSLSGVFLFCFFVFFPPLILFQLSSAGSEFVIASLVPLSVLFPLPQTLPLSSLSPLLSISRWLLISLPPTSIYHFHFTLLFPPSVLSGQLSRCQSARQDMNN